jgi:hypothetical protein
VDCGEEDVEGFWRSKKEIENEECFKKNIKTYFS